MSLIERTGESIPAAAIALLLAGCGLTDPGATGGVDRETFVDVYVELRAAARVPGDSAAFAAWKRRILERHGATAEGLEGFLDAHAGQIDYLTALWESVNSRVSTLAEDTISG